MQRLASACGNIKIHHHGSDPYPTQRRPAKESIGIDLPTKQHQFCLFTNAGGLVYRRIDTERSRFAAALGDRHFLAHVPWEYRKIKRPFPPPAAPTLSST